VVGGFFGEWLLEDYSPAGSTVRRAWTDVTALCPGPEMESSMTAKYLPALLSETAEMVRNGELLDDTKFVPPAESILYQV
jgi:hypothetical protein